MQVDRESPLPVYMQIRNQLREQILRGDLPSGTRLPSEREMARRLGVSRTTVVNAYDELMTEGLVQAHVGRGTIVVGPPAVWEGEAAPAQPINWQAHFTALGQRLQDSTSAELLALRRLSAQQGGISFAFGMPDPRLMSVDHLRQAWDAALSQVGAETVGSCCPTQGIALLRQLIAARLERQSISVSPENVVVVSGSQQGLDFLLRLLTEPGDTVIAEAPTYFGALQAFQAYGLRVLGVPVDQNGMEVEQVEFLLARYRPRLIYTVPTYQNPTGTTMSLERRTELLALAQRYQVPIIEDDPFSQLYFDEPPPPPIKALDAAGHVLYLGTFSKYLGPGLRIGFLVAPQPVTQLAIQLKRAADLQSNTLGQYLVVEFAQRGWLDELIVTARTAYSARCRTMDAALRRHLPSGAGWHMPDGGMFLWLELPAQVSAYDLLLEVRQRGVVFLPGHLMYPADGRRNTCRLNFSYPDEEAIEKGIAVLGAALRKLLRRGAKVETGQMITSAIV